MSTGRKVFAGFYCAWFTANGWSHFPTPQRLYEDDWSEGQNLWHKGGNFDVERKYWDGSEGWHFARPLDAKYLVYIARDKAAVQGAIDASAIFREALAHSLGFDIDAYESSRAAPPKAATQ